VFYDYFGCNYYQNIIGKLIGLQKTTTHFAITQSRAIMQSGMVKKI